MWNFSILTLTDRKGFGDFLPDPMLSIRVFSKMKDEEQQLVKLNLAGGYQTDSMKAKWDEKVSGNCELCGLPDTREHRLLECEALKEIRTDWEEVCQTISHRRREWVYLPVPRQHADGVLFRAWLQLIREPSTPEITIMVDNHYRFFTDGGAIHPQIPSARVASWAVIQDVAPSHDIRKTSLDFAFGPEPHFPTFKTISLGLVPGDQNVSRAELFAVLVVLRAVNNSAPNATVEIVTDASYVCLVLRAIEKKTWQRIAHRIPNVDIMHEIDQLWDPLRFRILKVKSHVPFEQAMRYEELWKFVGNHCADFAATSVLMSLPPDIKKLTDALAEHVRTEEKDFGNFLKYLVQFNRCRIQKLQDLKKSQGSSSQFQHARAAPLPVVGAFDSSLMGAEACAFLKTYGPDNFVHVPKVDADDEQYHLCLQGSNLGKALKTWLDTLRWPADAAEKDASDWGMSWFEMAVSFYLATGFQFPVRISGSGAKSKYVPYRSDEAMLLPSNHRTAALQGLCMRHMIQNLETILQCKLIPAPIITKCGSLIRLGFKPAVAGVARRPALPNPGETVQFTWDYIVSLEGNGILCKPIYKANLTPTLVFSPLDELGTADRFNRYAAYMKRLRKNRADGGG